ncbi:MAG TPA: hypothetical protein ENI94_12785 [Gammaproteobacteria bacterium]|nr:hypothetical protein [Gammaproteobacteria bacterium]
MHITKIRIPADLQFSDLRLARDPETGDIEFDAEILREICEDNDLPFSEEIVTSLMTAWYQHHRAQGGAPDQVMEQIIAEIEAEEITGVEIRGGSGSLN